MTSIQHYVTSPTLQAAPRGYPAAAATIEVASSASGVDLLYRLFIGVSLAAVFTILAALIKEGRSHSQARVIQREFEELIPRSSAAYGKEHFLARINAVDKRMLGGQVHYISELMRSSKADEDQARRLASVIVQESRAAQYDPILVAAIIKAESTFQRHAVSEKGARGLMQLMPETARYISDRSSLSWKGFDKLHDPAYNLQVGIAYLKYLSRLFGDDMKKVLIAYNWGPGNLLEALKSRKPIPATASQYAHKILSTHNKWRGEYRTKIAQYKYLDVEKYLG